MGWYESSLTQELNSILLAQISRRDDLALIRRAMLEAPAEQAKQGDAVADAQAFFARHRLDVIPLNKRAARAGAAHPARSDDDVGNPDHHGVRVAVRVDVSPSR